MRLVILFFFTLLSLFAGDVTVVVVNHTADTRLVQVRNSDRHMIGTITVLGGGSGSRTWSAESLKNGVAQLWVGDNEEGQVSFPSLQGRNRLTITIATDNRLSLE